MSLQPKYLVVIAGPTGVGKTALSVRLARHFNSVIVSADSRQFYKEMSIGTAKPTEAELSEVTHFFIGHLSIHDSYSIGDFEKDAIPLLGKLFETHQVIFLVGGSGLYINAVLYGVDEFTDVSAEIKQTVTENYEAHGLEWLQQQVKERDPAYYNRADIHNPQRLMRALEVCLQSGQPYSSFLSKTKKERRFDPVKILINTGRETVYDRINTRTLQMMAQGFEEEARQLLPFRHLNALNTVGYKELFDYFEGRSTFDKAVELIQQKTRNYAKRQLT
ncbi:MAG: tRNA (adenosine(37)-N6)-dimethylallyltransferase MiaA, partial [Bacteroidia bacterium]